MEFVSALFVLVLFATIVEFLVNIVKGILPEVALKILSPPRISAVVGLVVAFAVRLDVFSMLGFGGVSWIVAHTITGLIISAGSVAVHELISKLRESRTVIEDENSEQTYYTGTFTNVPPENKE